MGLEEFERELAASKDRERSGSHKRRARHHDDEDEDREGKRHRRHHHHHRSHKPRDGDERRHRHAHHRRDRADDDEGRHGHDRRHAAKAVASDDGEDEWVEREVVTAPPQSEEGARDARQDVAAAKPKRDAWMQEPGADEARIESVTSSRRIPQAAAKGQFVGAQHPHHHHHEFKVHEDEGRGHVADLQAGDVDDSHGHRVDDNTTAGAGAAASEGRNEPAQRQVSYTFGDGGSEWRMTKLRAVYRQAEESGEGVDAVALQRYGNLRDFDDAREEERELDRRKMYGRDYVGLVKPSGELFRERGQLEAGLHEKQQHHRHEEKGGHEMSQQQGGVIDQEPASKTTTLLDVSALNALKAQMMKAKMQNAPNAAQLEAEYNLAADASLANSTQPDVVVLNTMENRQLASGRHGEVVAAGTGKRARERGTVVENEDMSIEDMVRAEKRSRGISGGEGRAFAERIAKDAKFENDLDYLDNNATSLSRRVAKSDINLRNTAIGDFQKMQKILDTCPLCHHEERRASDALPQAPIVSLATRTYLTLPTEPEVAPGGAVVVPIQHRLNLLECDDDEWEELRNFMKSLTRHYHAQGSGVIFYENAAHMSSRKGHAALVAVPLPRDLAESAPAYFKEAILASDEQWSQHRPVIDTLALSQRPGYGKAAFRKAMVKEMPYFHVWFGLDGGMGHVIEDDRRWPKGDLFAREVVGGMLDHGPEVIKKQGRWARTDARVEKFRKGWGKWDWTQALL